MNCVMAPWDSKIRWQFGGNLQRVRLICELNWRECPVAIVNYIWSEIVTDVVECVTNEGILLRLIILILVFTILLHTIWTRTQWMTDCVVSKDSLNRVNFKIQDLELRVNVLTYKIQYGTWPLPQEIIGPGIEEKKDNVKLSLSSSGNRNSWLNRYLDGSYSKNHHISRSENLGLRLRKPKTLIETSRKIYYNQPNKMCELQLRKGIKKCTEVVNNEKKYCIKKKEQDTVKETNIPKSIVKAHGEKEKNLRAVNSLVASNRTYIPSKSIDNNVSIATTTESSCEDSGGRLSDSSNITSKKIVSSPRIFFKKKISGIGCSMSFERINSTQETLTNVKEQLENLHTALKTYGSQQNLKLVEQKNNKDQLANTLNQDCDKLCVKTEKIDEKSAENIATQSIKPDSVKDDNAESSKQLSSSENNENERINAKKNSQVSNKSDEMKSSTLIDTDEDLGSISSQPEPSKSSDSDKSTQSSDALMLGALLNQLDWNNLKRWNNKCTIDNTEEDSEYDTESIFPKMKSFCQTKLLDIISEEQSGSSCTEKVSKTTIHPISSDKKNFLPNPTINIADNKSINKNEFSESTQHHITTDRNTHVELRTFKLDDETKNENTEIPKSTKYPMDNLTCANNENIPEVSKTLSQKENNTILNTVESNSPWDGAMEYSSRESIENYIPSRRNSNLKLTVENITSTSSNTDELNNLSDIQNGEQLIDISNLTLKRRPGIFSIAQSTNTVELDDQMTESTEDDLIDLNFDDNNKNTMKPEEIVCKDKFNLSLSLMDIANDISNIEDIECQSDSVPVTERTIICSKKLNSKNKFAVDNNKIKSIQKDNKVHCVNSSKNTDSKSLIELERIAYKELKEVENSWDSDCFSNENCEKISRTADNVPVREDKKLHLWDEKLFSNIISSPSSVYLTVQGSFSNISMDSNELIESIEKIEMPEEIENLDNADDCITVNENKLLIEPKVPCDSNNKIAYGFKTKVNNRKDNEDEKCTVMSKDSAISETPQHSILAVNNTDSNEKFINVETLSVNSSIGTSSYVDAHNNNLMCSSGISLSFDRPELTLSLDKITATPTSLKKLKTKASVESAKNTKEKSVMKNLEPKNLNKSKIDNKIQITSAKAKSNLNLTRENSMNLLKQKSDKQNIEFGQRRSKSYITPRKLDATSKNSLTTRNSNKIQGQDSSPKLNNSENNMMNNKNNLTNRRSSSKIKCERTNLLSKSRESVNKSTSKSCIPLFKTRFDTSKNIDSRPRSPLRGPLTMSVDVECNSVEKNIGDRSLCINKNDNGDNEAKIIDQRINNVEIKKNSPTVPEGQTIFYVNIVTDHDNSVTKAIDSKKIFDSIMNKDFNVQNILKEYRHDNRSENNTEECSNAKFVAVISSTDRNPIPFYQQREIEVLAKPSVTDTSTSVSDLAINDTQLEASTNDEYIVLLKSIGQDESNSQE